MIGVAAFGLQYSQGGKTYEEAVYVHMILNFPVLNVQKFDQT
jgi:hypothetical protein